MYMSSCNVIKFLNDFMGDYYVKSIFNGMIWSHVIYLFPKNKWVLTG